MPAADFTMEMDCKPSWADRFREQSVSASAAIKLIFLVVLFIFCFL